MFGCVARRHVGVREHPVAQAGENLQLALRIGGADPVGPRLHVERVEGQRRYRFKEARLRAAEEGLPVIRSTPTGISALIDAHGLVLKSIPWQTAGFIDGELPAPLPQTFFGRFGNVIPLMLGFLLLIAAIALSRGARYRAI